MPREPFQGSDWGERTPGTTSDAGPGRGRRRALLVVPAASKYQFHRGTWASVGGTGDPARASEIEQDRRAAMLIKRSGSSPWPACG